MLQGRDDLPVDVVQIELVLRIPRHYSSIVAFPSCYMLTIPEISQYDPPYSSRSWIFDQVAAVSGAATGTRPATRPRDTDPASAAAALPPLATLRSRHGGCIGLAEFVADLDERTSAVPPDIPFSREEYAGRLDRLRAAMAEDGIDTLLLSSPEAMNWLHGLSLRWYKAQAPRMWRPLTCTAVHVDHDRFIQFEGIEHRRCCAAPRSPRTSGCFPGTGGTTCSASSWASSRRKAGWPARSAWRSTAMCPTRPWRR